VRLLAILWPLTFGLPWDGSGHHSFIGFLCCFLFDYSYTYLLQFTITKSLIAAEIGQCGGVMWVVTVVGVPTT